MTVLASRTLRALSAAAPLAVMTLGCGATGSSAASSPTRHALVVSEIAAFLRTYGAALESREPAAIRGLFVADDRFGIYEDGTLRYATVDSVLRALAAFPPGTRVTTVYSGARITPLSPDLAAAAVSFETRIAMGSGDDFSFAGVTTLVVERADDGWKAVTAHTSSVRHRGGS